MAARICAVRNESGGAVRWIPAENLHLTLKFLGNIEEAQVASIRSALQEALADTAGFCVTARGIGVFPASRRPRVLWVGLAATELGQLAGRVERALEPLGVGRATTRFRPHVTIGRWRRPESQGVALRKELDHWSDREFGVFRVDEVALFRSVLRPAGAVHSTLEVFPLDAAASPPRAAEGGECEAGPCAVS